MSSLLLLLVSLASSKVVDISSASSGPQILSQFCFPTVRPTQGKGSISIEAESPLPGHRVAFLELVSTAEVHSLLKFGCEVLSTQRLVQETFFSFLLSKPNQEYYNMIEVNSPMQKFCLTGVVINCSGSDSNTDVELYVEYINEGVDAWDTSLSLEDQGMPALINFYTLCFSVVFLIFWKIISDTERLGAHAELLLTAKLAYCGLEGELLGWMAYYWSYSLLGSPAVLIKSVACYAHWVFELATLSLLCLHATGHFKWSVRAPGEVKLFLVVYGAISLYMAVLRSSESEEMLEFHWFCWSWGAKWSRLVAACLLLLWSIKGIVARAEDERELFGLLAYAGLLWTVGEPAIIWLTKLMMRYRWKYYQALLGVFADGCFLTFSLAFLHKDAAGIIFTGENVVRRLKEGKA